MALVQFELALRQDAVVLRILPVLSIRLYGAELLDQGHGKVPGQTLAGEQQLEILDAGPGAYLAMTINRRPFVGVVEFGRAVGGNFCPSAMLNDGS